MRTRDHIRAVDGEEAQAETAPQAGEAAEWVNDENSAAVDDWYEEPAPGRSYAWLVPTLAVLAIAGWTVFFAWAHRSEMLVGAGSQQWSAWITSWAIPVLLVVALWLLAMRSSAREASRFGNVAHLLSEELARLETRLVTINRELSLAREFLGTQTHELDYLGRIATERLSEHAHKLQSLVRDNGAQVDAIASVSSTALENMGKLRDDLPVIANSARDVSNQIGNAGRTAQDQLEELVAGFQRLNEFGSASERQVVSLRKRMDEALTAFTAQADQLEHIASERFVALRENSERFREDLAGREIEVLAAIRTRADALRDELASSHLTAVGEEEHIVAALRERMTALRDEAATAAHDIRTGEEAALATWGDQIAALQNRLQAALEEISGIDERALHAANAKLEALRSEAELVDGRIAERNAKFEHEVVRRREEFDLAEQRAADQLAERLARLDLAIAQRREAQLAQLAQLEQQSEALAATVGALGEQFATVSGQGDEARGLIVDGIDALNTKLVESREALDGTDMAVAALTDSSVRLLELIQASAKHSRDDLPVAMQETETRLTGIEHRADEIRNLLDQARQAGEAATQSMDAAEERGREAIATVEGFQSRFGETAAAQIDSIERLRSGVAALGNESGVVAQRAQGELRDAIAALETSAREALAAIETEQAERIESIAGKVGERSAEAIDRAVEEHSAEAIARLDEATQRSTEGAREAVGLLRDQFAKVNELAGNLENRVMRARERAEEQVDNDFSRRVALLTESLNSNAIDISKALSTEVTDSAWTSYLRGDRGIFTRRAVRLLDNTEARAIAELYDADRDFREHVSRYIHDFEAMLRTMLSTRDGNAVSVTLLSSDMGKLYVVLAQAIERLRE